MLRQPRGVGGRFRREGTHVYLWLIYVVKWQKPTQHCKVIIIQIKKKNQQEKKLCTSLSNDIISPSGDIL